VSISPILLAGDLTQTVLTSWRMSNPATREKLLIFGALGSVSLLILIWALFIRKGPRAPRDHRHWQHHSSGPTQVAQASAGGETSPPSEKRRRKRRSGHQHRPRNPTLAETGGLPPIRPEGPTEPQA
jgi:hypothetical protein